MAVDLADYSIIPQLNVIKRSTLFEGDENENQTYGHVAYYDCWMDEPGSSPFGIFGYSGFPYEVVRNTYSASIFNITA